MASIDARDVDADEECDEGDAPEPTDYYVLLPFMTADSAKLTTQPWSELPRRYRTWISGQRLPAEVAVPSPLEFQIDQDDEGVMPHYFDTGIPLMSAKLVEALRQTGVDNLDTYPALITLTSTGLQCRDYHAVNIVGLVAASDAAAGSQEALIEGAAGATWFHKLAISPALARGQLMFRLAESSSKVIVHRAVKKAVENAGIAGLDYVHPADYSG